MPDEPARLSGELQRLIDRAAISDVVIAYATGVDTRNWELYRSIFTDPCTFDFSSWNGRPAVSMPADDWVTGVRGTLSGFDATQHISSNHVITFERAEAAGDDRARCVSYMQAQHFLADQPVTCCTLGGYYTNDLVHTDDGWKITRCQLTVTWSTGDRGLFGIARARWAARE